MINKGYLKSDTSRDGDECYTPLYAVEPLLEFVHGTNIRIWCPFDAPWSAFSQVFSKNGFEVVCSHLDKNQDFFLYQPDRWDILISNPPFSQKNAVLKRSCDLGKPFALLLPTTSIQGKTRFDIFNNDIQLLCFDQRIDFYTGNNFDSPAKGVAFASSYFCRGLLPSKLELRRLNKRTEPLYRRTYEPELPTPKTG